MPELNKHEVAFLQGVENPVEAALVAKRLSRETAPREVGYRQTFAEKGGKALSPAAPRLALLVCYGGIAAQIDDARGIVAHYSRLGHARRVGYDGQIEGVWIWSFSRRAVRLRGRTFNASREGDFLCLARLRRHFGKRHPAPLELHPVASGLFLVAECEGDVVVADIEFLRIDKHL